MIGRVIEVSGGEVTLVLCGESLDEKGNKRGVPDSMKIVVTTENGPTPLLIGQPGSFVEVELPSGTMIGTVTSVRMVEAVPTSGESKYASEESGVPVLESRRLLTTVPVGRFHSDGSFERGSDILPTVNSEVYAVEPERIGSIYKSLSGRDFSVGSLSILPAQRAYVDLDVLLGRHAAVLGQTGGGKSWTVASVLQRIAKLPRSTVLLLDLHREYEAAFGEEAEYVSAGDIELPYWLMNFEELMGICIDRGEHTAPNQIAKFRDLVQKEKEATAAEEHLDLPKVTLDTPVYFGFDSIIKELKKLDVEMVSSASTGKPKQGDYFGNFTRMIMRLESKLNDRRYDLIFKPNTYTSSASMEQLFRTILGEGDPPKKIVVLDVSPIPFDVRTSVISLVLRLVFDFAYWHRRSQGKEYPVLVVCDEAHVYLNDNSDSSAASRLAAERIAKEGRKYGVGLMVVSQRPRELSSTILSQCNTFVCLRLTNPDDQSFVKNLLPDSVRGIVDMVASLRRGEAIILGESVIMPTRVRIDPPDPHPNSNDISFVRNWSCQEVSVPLAEVIDEWRRQGVERATQSQHKGWYAGESGTGASTAAVETCSG